MAWPSGGPRTWNPGETVTADQMNEQLRDALNLLATYYDTDTGIYDAIRVFRQTADVTKNASVAYSDLTGLALPILASETWIWLAVLFTVAASATPDMKFTFTGPASPTTVKFGAMRDGAAIGQAFNSSFGSDVAVQKSADSDLTLLAGICQNGANAGTIQAQFAQSTSNASNSVVQQESFMLAVRLLP